MVESATFQTIFQFLQTVGILVGVFYYISTIRTNQRNQQLALEARQTQMFIEHHDKIMRDPLNTAFFELLEWEWDSYDDFVEKYGRPWFSTEETKHLKSASKFIDVFGYYEGLGVLVQTSDINIELIARFGGVTLIWDKFEPIVFEIRRRHEMPGAWQEFEELVIRLKEFDRSTTLFTDERASRKRRREALGMPTH
jgi:hypothetical protein